MPKVKIATVFGHYSHSEPFGEAQDKLSEESSPSYLVQCSHYLQKEYSCCSTLLFHHERFEPGAKFVDFVFVLFQAGEKIFALRVEDIEGVDDAFFDDVDAERVLASQPLKLRLSIAA